MGTKISELTAGTKPTGAEIVPTVQGGVTVKLTEADFDINPEDVRTITGNATATTADRVIVFTGASDAALTLYSTAATGARALYVANKSDKVLTLTPQSGQTVDSSSLLAGEDGHFVPSGTAWKRLDSAVFASLSATSVTSPLVTADDIKTKGPIVDARAYGVGEADDTAAFTTLLGLAGKTVYLPAGTYTTTSSAASPIAVKCNLVGEGSEIVGHLKIDASNIRITRIKAKQIQINDNLSDIEISDCVIDAVGGSFQPITAATANNTHCNRIKILRNKITGCNVADGGGVSLPGGNSDTLIIDGNTIYSNAYNGIVLGMNNDGSSYNWKNVKIVRNVIQGNGTANPTSNQYHGVYATALHDSEISLNDIVDHKGGNGLNLRTDAFNSGKNLRITGNNFRDIFSNDGISQSGYVGVTISDNTMENVRRFNIGVYGGSDITITGNTFRQTDLTKVSTDPFQYSVISTRGGVSTSRLLIDGNSYYGVAGGRYSFFDTDGYASSPATDAAVSDLILSNNYAENLYWSFIYHRGTGALTGYSVIGNRVNVGRGFFMITGPASLGVITDNHGRNMVDSYKGYAYQFDTAYVDHVHGNTFRTDAGVTYRLNNIQAGRVWNYGAIDTATHRNAAGVVYAPVQGDYFFNTSPVAGGSFGTVYVASGTRTFGAIAA